MAELTFRFGDRCTTNPAICERHGADESWHPPSSPDAVVFAETVTEVQTVIGVCARRGVPLIAYGSGTSLEGHVAALAGGISLDLSRMNRVLQVRVEDLDCSVEPGVTRQQLNAYLRDMGLFFSARSRG